MNRYLAYEKHDSTLSFGFISIVFQGRLEISSRGLAFMFYLRRREELSALYRQRSIRRKIMLVKSIFF